ncbi:MAG: hypothetical protein HKN30_04220 [Sulfitobacter sp.]|nr:hypothetical protein [Sulfitobacter sp.]
MTEQNEYRVAILPRLGRVLVPTGLTDAEVMAQLDAAEEEDAKKPKTKKKPSIRP